MRDPCRTVLVSSSRMHAALAVSAQVLQAEVYFKLHAALYRALRLIAYRQTHNNLWSIVLNMLPTDRQGVDFI